MAATAPPQLLSEALVITGPTWSGKTSRLIDAARELAPRFDRVVVVKHAIDTRYASGVLASRTGLRMDAHLCVADLRDVPVPPVGGARTLFAVDEAQFFGPSLLDFYSRLASAFSPAPAHAAPGGGSPVKEAPALSPHGLLVAGLDLDFKKAAFGCCLELAQKLPAASLVRLTARCDFSAGGAGRACNADAAFSQRLLAGGSATVVVDSGAGVFYAPACAAHHRVEPGIAEAWGRGAAAEGKEAAAAAAAAVAAEMVVV
jgi:thymidine kinase